MSHYSAIPLELLDGELLVETLKLFGFTPTYTVDLQKLVTLQDLELTNHLNANAQPLYGYANDQRPEKAHIVVSRKQLGQACNDLGFVCNGKQWSMIISDWDQTHGSAEPDGVHVPRRGLGRHFRYRFMNEYCRLNVLATAAKLGHTAEVEQIGDGYRIVVKPQPVKAKKALMQTTQQRSTSRMQSRL